MNTRFINLPIRLVESDAFVNVCFQVTHGTCHGKTSRRGQLAHAEQVEERLDCGRVDDESEEHDARRVQQDLRQTQECSWNMN